MSDTKIRKVGTITLVNTEYDLAVNGRGMLAREELDIYDRPYAHEIRILDLIGPQYNDEQVSKCLENVCQELLTLLAQTMVERDAALLTLQKGQAQ